MDPAGSPKSPYDFPASWLRPDLWLEEKARDLPDKPALLFRDRPITYREFWQRVSRLAAGLLRTGLQPGDRIACMTTNHPAFLETYFASSLVGAIFVPLNFRLAAAELLFQLEDADPSILILGAAGRNHASTLVRDLQTRTVQVFQIDAGTETQTRPYETLLTDCGARVREKAARPFSPEDPQIIMYTSGTTGEPKGALLPYRKTLYNSLNAECFFELRQDDSVLIPVPLFHSLGLNILSIPVLFRGGTVVLLERFDPASTLEAVARHRVTFTGAVPTIYKRLLDHGLQGWDLTSLRFAFTAGAPIPVSLIEEYHRRGILLKQGFGQTETSILCCLDARDAIRKAGTVGKPVAHAEVKVTDDRLQEVPVGETGEIVARGPIVMSGYWRRPEETEKAFHEGWLRTQDLAVRDTEGFITLVGRKGDMYISGGENVHPAEVERALQTHPDVGEAAVVGIPDEDLGEVGIALLVLRQGRRLDEEALKAFLRGRLSGYKIPRRFVQVESFPRTVTGKIRKFRLRERLRTTIRG